MEKITIEVYVNAPIKRVWEAWTMPPHITKWSYASADWHAPYAENDLVEGGKFLTTMAAKDGSMEFDFGGTYTKVIPYECLSYTMDDGREVEVYFVEDAGGVKITEVFDPESENPIEMQRTGWQAILNNFKAYTEAIL